jgi:hypothetical protein
MFVGLAYHEGTYTCVGLVSKRLIANPYMPLTNRHTSWLQLLPTKYNQHLHPGDWVACIGYLWVNIQIVVHTGSLAFLKNVFFIILMRSDPGFCGSSHCGRYQKYLV